MTTDTIVVMARYPQPGAVKTRLARAIGADAACALYAAFLADLHAMLRTAAWPVVWAVTPPASDFSALLGHPIRQITQRGDALAARMRQAFADVFNAGAPRVMMLGADAPHIGTAQLDAAWTALDAADCVLMPTRDGGYCLIALAAPYDLFSGIEMGTARVLDDTLALAHRLGARTVQLPATFDVDEVADLHALIALIEDGAVSLPHTQAAYRAVERR